MNAKDITEVDVRIGKKMREQRLIKGMTRCEVGKSLNISHEQTRKYEEAINRITAARLLEFSELVNKPISYFYDEQDIIKTKDDRVLLDGRRTLGELSLSGKVAIVGVMKQMKKK